jgi:hypothetical protein
MEETTQGGSWRAIVPLSDNEFRNGRAGALAFLWQHGVFVGLIVWLIRTAAPAIHVAHEYTAVGFHVKACSSRFSTNRTFSRQLLGTKFGLGVCWQRGKDRHFAAISRRVDNGRLHVVATLQHLPALPFFFMQQAKDAPPLEYQHVDIVIVRLPSLPANNNQCCRWRRGRFVLLLICGRGRRCRCAA